MVTRSRLTSTEAAASSQRSPPRSASQWPRPRPRSQFPILIPILTLQPRIPWKSRFVSMVFLLALATVVFIVTGLRILTYLWKISTRRNAHNMKNIPNTFHDI